jgi:hypothetical protein
MSRILAKVQLFTKCQVPTAAVARSTTIRRRSKSNYNYNYNCNCNCNDNGKINCTATATEWVLLQQSIGSLRGHLPVLMAHQALCGGETSILYSYELWEGRISNDNHFLLVRGTLGERISPRAPPRSSESQPAEETDQ